LKCYWSEMRLNYDPAYNMYLKDQGNGRTNREFFVIPGLRSQEGVSKVFTGKRSFGECKYNCFTDETCNAFGYNKETQDCNGLQSAVEYDEEFQYYEKQTPLEGGTRTNRQMMQEKISQENAEKERLKLKWNTIVETSNKEIATKKKEFMDDDSDSPELGSARKDSSGGWTTVSMLHHHHGP